MLTLTRKTDYAMIALTRLAQEPDRCSSAREIATQYGIPLPLLMNILKLLTQRGLARSARGQRGGYALAMPAHQITLRDIIKAVEGPIQLVYCAGTKEARQSPKSRGKCGLTARCPVRPSMHQVHQRLVDFLGSVTLADVLDNNSTTRHPNRRADA
jgi:Rrf2 family protein